MFRSAFISASVLRTSVVKFHSSSVTFKTVTEKVSEAAGKVNLKVGQGLASAIEKGENATNSAKETIGAATADAKAGAKKTGRVAEKEANQAAAGAHEAKKGFEKEIRK